VCVPNAATAAYKECTRPMPPLSPHRPTEVLITAKERGKPLPSATVVLVPKAGQACPPLGLRADAQGRAWFVLSEAGAYDVRVEGKTRSTRVELKKLPFKLEAGFGYLPRIIVEIAQ